jgi:hypothetical protein
MDQKPFSIVAGLIFTLVALFHLVRIYMSWPVDIGDWSVPMWFSWISLVVAGGLAFFGLRLAERDASRAASVRRPRHHKSCQRRSRA